MQSFKTVSILTVFCDASACSAVKLKDMVISLGKSTVPLWISSFKSLSGPGMSGSAAVGRVEMPERGGDMA